MLEPNMDVAEPSEKWKKWAGEDLRVFLMWRPVGRDFCEEDRARWAKSEQ